MSDKKSNNKGYFEKVKLTDEQLNNKKLQLEQFEQNKINSDLELKQMERALDLRLPSRQVEDQIKKYEKQLEKGKDSEENELYESDKESIKLHIEKLKEHLENDLPMKGLRLQIKQMKNEKSQAHSPDKQIPKLKKEVREGYAEIYKPNSSQNYTG